MRLDARVVVAPLLAVIVMALIVFQTREALKLSGAWYRSPKTGPSAPSPFASIEGLLARPPAPRVSSAYDPFRPRSTGVVATNSRRQPVRIVKPAAPPVPVLTSIVFDADPRATLRWNGRDYSVRAGALFADFRVVSITREQVALDRGGESVILRLPQRGDNP